MANTMQHVKNARTSAAKVDTIMPVAACAVMLSSPAFRYLPSPGGEGGTYGCELDCAVEAAIITQIRITTSNINVKLANTAAGASKLVGTEVVDIEVCL